MAILATRAAVNSTGDFSPLVHGALEKWSRERPDAVAIDDGHAHLGFRDLHREVEMAARAITLARAPATVFIDDNESTLRKTVAFLAIIATGRCAAVGDADWPDAVKQSVRHALAGGPFVSRPPVAQDAFYIGFTSGSTGMPKGFRRDHRSWAESFRICAETFGADAMSRIAAPGRFSHSLFLFGILFGLWSGGGVKVQERFSPGRLLASLARGETSCLLAVPSQLVMVLDAARRKGTPPIEGVRIIMISGARWMRERTPELRALFPGARIVEFYGASETSFIAWMEADETVPHDVVGKPFANVEVEIRKAVDEDSCGLMFVRSPMLFMDYALGVDDATAAIRDGEWLSVRDAGRIDDSGRLCLAGRESRMIVTQGKNMFPEELESVLMGHDAVVAASVHGVRHPVRGQEVTAVVNLRERYSTTASELVSWCRARLESYKTPRALLVCDPWPLTASGKTDHQGMARMLASMPSVPCMRPLP